MKSPLLAPVLAALFLAATPAAFLAQDIEGPSVSPGASVLTINAAGTSGRTPDLAMFTAGVATTGQTAGEALAANSQAMNRVIRALKAAGIADRDIQTSNLNVSPVYGDNNRQPGNVLENELPHIVGYRANNQVMVKQRKIDQFGKVIDTLVSAGANQVDGPSFQMDDPDEALDEARLDAIRTARQRAQLYASAAGLQVKRILTISESGGYSPRPPMMMARVASDKAESTPVAAGEVEMQVNITVAFELAP